MTNAIFSKAETLRRMIAERGLAVGGLNTSINRNGGYSAYFDCAGGDRIRVSDHDTICNDSCKWWGDADEQTVDAFVARRFWNMAVSAELTIISHRAHERKEAERRAAFEELQDRADANNAMLAAAGYDVSTMTKNQRKDALKALRRGAMQPGA
ncbi:hypothetical protein [Sphingopyxis indica]|uniref:Uncharacterized protein n=1 Tax=Sphingopyxis indica TaxID=436663 RepID=A0A239KNB0_9SPHN|nr:hypothetical protein [Sphingopyxis indica]SNT19158.1 hypothetical protein SAMN06295955_11536 [Sphingopyxis indica]